MILVVAEKPSVARDIARVLKCRDKGEGYIAGEGYTVTWALGHLVTLQEPDELDARYKKWRMEDLPILPDTLPTKVISKTRSQFSAVKKLMLQKEVERVICATDAGREGELIFGLIYEKAGCKKPVDRLWISSMTDAAIREGFDSLKPGEQYRGLYESALCRSQADWLVGMNASRAFTLSYDALLSLGRVQTPTLAILVKRRQEIRAFVPEQYHTLTADFGDYKGQWFDPGVKDERINTRISDKATAEALKKKLSGQQAAVLDVAKEEKRELPPQLFDLTSLQREANRVLGFTASRTLKAAQALYEQRKALTYPRTDSRYLPKDMLPRVYQTMTALEKPYKAFAALIERKGDKLPFSRRIYDDQKVSDHHAIIPTPQLPELAKLTADERALYELVAKRFIAAFCPEHRYEETRVTTESLGERFKTLGKRVLQMGWKAVEGGKEKPEEALPDLKVKDQRRIEKLTLKQESTKPPSEHNDASLLAAMEHAGKQIEDEALRESMKGAGLGTPATRASIIDRLIQVRYAERKGKAIMATEKGEKLIAVAPEELSSPELTGRWEQALEEIARGKGDSQRFMQGIRRFTAFLVEAAAKPKEGIAFEKELRGRGGKVRPAQSLLPDAACPLCGKPVQENSKAFGCSAWREGCRFTLWKNGLKRAGGPMLTKALVGKLLKQGELKGSTGLLSMKEGQLSFTPKGKEAPALSIPITYERKPR